MSTPNLPSVSPRSADAGFSDPRRPEPRVRRRYPSDLTDRQWAAIAPLLPPDARTGRRRRQPLREVLDALNYRWETGCAWRMLPHDFPPWGTVYRYYRHWQRTGALHRLHDALIRPR
jgi:transposase